MVWILGLGLPCPEPHTQNMTGKVLARLMIVSYELILATIIVQGNLPTTFTIIKPTAISNAEHLYSLQMLSCSYGVAGGDAIMDYAIVAQPALHVE